MSGINPQYYGEITAPKTITSGTIHIPRNNEKTEIYLQANEPFEGYYRVIIGRERNASIDMQSGYWKLLLIYEKDHCVFRVDYGFDLYTHHFVESHVHIGIPQVDEIAFEIDDDVIQELFPYIYIPNDSDVCYNENEEDSSVAIEEAIMGFLTTINTLNLNDIGGFYYEE